MHVGHVVLILRHTFKIWREVVKSEISADTMIGTPDLHHSPSTPKKEDRALLIASGLSPCARTELRHLEQFSDAKMLVIEGNIGVGKTTLARALAERLEYKAFLEPALENPFLERFYADPHKYALKLQLWIFRQRYQTFLQAVRHMRATGKYQCSRLSTMQVSKTVDEFLLVHQ